METLFEQRSCGAAVLVSEERIQEVCRVADRFYGMRAGKIVASGVLTDLTDEILHEIYL
jgi:ABC-type branched-subunit amino acid transport system ATPase component